MSLSHRQDQGRVQPASGSKGYITKNIQQSSNWQYDNVKICVCIYKYSKHSPLPSFQAEQMLVTRSVSQTFRILDILKMFTTLNDFDLQRNFPLRNKLYRFKP